MKLDNPEKINRVEIIDHTEEGDSRAYVKWGDNIQVEPQLQDDGKTLKIFIDEKSI